MKKTHLRIDILTLFPKTIQNFFKFSVAARAIKKGLVQIVVHNLRNWGSGQRQTTDDKPYGGGPGMILTLPPIARALKELKKKSEATKSYVILLSASGKRLNQIMVQKLARKKHLILICGHYEGVDQRVATLADEEISIGDYVLQGGEAAALVVADAVTRLVPGVLGNANSIKRESFVGGLLEYPQYTRPAFFQGSKVPSILLHGHHANIEKWRKSEALKRTKKMRLDLLKSGSDESLKSTPRRPA